MKYKLLVLDVDGTLLNSEKAITARTQAALLEVMEEGSVSVDGVTMKLEQPFLVIATQNPYGSAGTQQLPESQLDRFMIRLEIGYLL